MRKPERKARPRLLDPGTGRLTIKRVRREDAAHIVRALEAIQQSRAGRWPADLPLPGPRGHREQRLERAFALKGWGAIDEQAAFVRPAGQTF